VSFATIVGPLLAGLLLGWVSPGLLLALDAASFAFLGIVAWRAGAATEAVQQPIDARAAESGFRLLRRPDLLSLTLVTWVFFFLYGPVEVALPVYVAVDLHAPSGLLGAYWTCAGGVGTPIPPPAHRSAARRPPSPRQRAKQRCRGTRMKRHRRLAAGPD
jgi:hypothetical protein